MGTTMRHTLLLWSAAWATAMVAGAGVWQFDTTTAVTVTTDASNYVEQWQALKNHVVLAPLHGRSNGWEHAKFSGSASQKMGVDFSSNPAVAPFVATTNATAHFALAVVRCAAPTPLATLFGTPCAVRFESNVWFDTAPALSTRQRSHTVSYTVNGITTNEFLGSSDFQLVEVAWDEAIKLDEVYVGGAAGSPAWQRGWVGEIGELIFFATKPTQLEREALRRYAAIKWGVPVSVSSPNAKNILHDMGIVAGSYFATILILK